MNFMGHSHIGNAHREMPCCKWIHLIIKLEILQFNGEYPRGTSVGDGFPLTVDDSVFH